MVSPGQNPRENHKSFNHLPFACVCVIGKWEELLGGGVRGRGDTSLRLPKTLEYSLYGVLFPY